MASRSSLPVQAALPSEAPAPPIQVPAPPREPARSAGAASSKWFSDPRGQGSGGMGTSDQPPQPAGQPNGGMHYQVMAEPVSGDQTSSGPPMRVPQANLMPGSIDAARRADTEMPGYQADRRDPHHSAQGWGQRSPEIARSRLSGFQRGVRRGKTQTPGAREGSDR